MHSSPVEDEKPPLSREATTKEQDEKSVAKLVGLLGPQSPDGKNLPDPSRAEAGAHGSEHAAPTAPVASAEQKMGPLGNRESSAVRSAPSTRWASLGQLIIKVTQVLAPLYFVAGAVIVALDHWEWSDYLSIGGLVGGVASVVGLVGLGRRTLVSDVLQLEAETIASVVNAANELDDLLSKKAEAHQHIDELAIQRKRLEIIVKKASLALFLKEQHRLYENRVAEALDQMPQLRADIDELKRLQVQLRDLEEEIASHEDVKLLTEIMRLSPTHRYMPSSPRAFAELAEDIASAFISVFTRR